MDKSKNSTPFSLSKAHFKNPHLTFQEVSVNFDENNFFNTKKEEVVPVIKEPKKPIKSTRLNDYDGNILSNVATIKPIRKTFKEKIEKVIKPKFQLQNLIPKSFEDLFALFLPSLYKSTKVRETLKRLKELNNEDFIWIVYIGIIIFCAMVLLLPPRGCRMARLRLRLRRPAAAAAMPELARRLCLGMRCFGGRPRSIAVLRAMRPRGRLLRRLD